MVVLKSPPGSAIWGSFSAHRPNLETHGRLISRSWVWAYLEEWAPWHTGQCPRQHSGQGGSALLISSPRSAHAATSSQRAGDSSDPDASAVCLGRMSPLLGLGCLFPEAASGSEEPASSVLGSLSLCPILHVHFQPQALVERLSLLMVALCAPLHPQSKGVHDNPYLIGLSWRWSEIKHETLVWGHNRCLVNVAAIIVIIIINTVITTIIIVIIIITIGFWRQLPRDQSQSRAVWPQASNSSGPRFLIKQTDCSFWCFLSPPLFRVSESLAEQILITSLVGSWARDLTSLNLKFLHQMNGVNITIHSQCNWED